MLSLEFGSVCAAATDDWQIRRRLSAPAAASKTFFNDYNNPHKTITFMEYLCLKISLCTFHCLYIVKANVTGLTEECASLFTLSVM